MVKMNIIGKDLENFMRDMETLRELNGNKTEINIDIYSEKFISYFIAIKIFLEFENN